MKSRTELISMFTSLSQNVSTDNQSLAAKLINDQHRYLIQRYFDNLYTSFMATVGSQDLTATASIAANATSTTLNAVWAYPTGTALCTFSDGEARTVQFTNGSAAITWAVGLNDAVDADISMTGIQFYQLAANISKLKDVMVTVGQLKFLPMPVQTQQEWDTINFLPYNSDIPQYFFIYNNMLGIFPIPSTTGNVITYNFKRRVADLSYTDYSTGTVAAAQGSTAVTGTTTSWNTTGTFPLNVDLTYANLYIKIDPPKGDGIWYQIQRFTSDTALVLVNPIVNQPVASGATYTIGQFPLLSEDFHDMLVYGALMVYFNSIVSNKDKFKLYDALFKTRLEALEEYAGTRQVNVDLGAEPNPKNPNLFIYATN